jgi:Arm DNA-binding domain
MKKIDFFDIEQRGFMLEVRRSGGKTYYQRYTDERGRERQFKIGPADVLSLSAARRKARTTAAERWSVRTRRIAVPRCAPYRRSPNWCATAICRT